ncbi:MAG TPA: hypothetical protein VF867_19980 [Arthrobacter sp.]
MSNQNRVQPGIPTGGEFSATAHAESSLALADPATRPVTVAPGESENYNELADGDVIETLNVTRSHVDDGTGYTISAGKTLNMKDILPATDLGTNEAGQDAYLERHTAQIEDFLRDRYEADLENTDWEEVSIECSTSLTDAPLTEGSVVEAAWNGTRIVALHNESDPGTFGSDSLGRLLREQISRSSSVEDRYAARGAAMRMHPEDVKALVADRYMKRELSDAGALAIAGSMRSADRPALARLAVRGYGDSADLYTELNLAWLNNQLSPGRSAAYANQVDMMRNWVRNGPDND